MMPNYALQPSRAGRKPIARAAEHRRKLSFGEMMPINFRYLILSLSLVLLLGNWAWADGASTKEELLQKFEQAVRSNNESELRSLFNWEGADEQMKTASEQLIVQLTKYPPQKINLEPLPNDFQSEFVISGTRYRPNVVLDGRIRIRYGADGPPHTPSIAIPYGQKGGRYYIPVTVKEKTGYIGPPDRQLNIVVQGTSAPMEVRFSGSCSYVASGEKKTVDITGEGNRSIVVMGQDVESCMIRKLPSEGWIKLVIYVNGQKVYESERVDSAQPISYRR